MLIPVGKGLHASKNNLSPTLYALEQYIVFRQDTKSNDDYFKAFIGVVSIYEHLGGTLTHGTAFEIEIAARIATGVADGEDVDVATKRATAIIRDKVLATALIKRSGTKYATLRKDLANAYALGDDKYPSDLTITLSNLNAYIGPAKESQRDQNSRTQLHFAQVSGGGAALVAGTNGRVWDGVLCYACNSIGHYAMDCPCAAGTAAAPAGAACAGTAAAAAAAATAARQVRFDFLQRHAVGSTVSNALNVSLTQSPLTQSP